MRTQCAALILAALGGAVSADDKPEQAEAIKKLQGAWIVKTAQISGQPLPDEIGRSIKLEINKSDYTTLVGGRPDKGSFEIDVAKTPMQMTIKGKSGPNSGKTLPCIFEFQGKNVRICYGLDGKNRPSEFKTTAMDKFFLVTYEKAPASP